VPISGSEATPCAMNPTPVAPRSCSQLFINLLLPRKGFSGAEDQTRRSGSFPGRPQRELGPAPCANVGECLGQVHACLGQNRASLTLNSPQGFSGTAFSILHQNVMGRAPPRGSGTSPEVRGITWTWRGWTVWPAASPTFTPML